MMKASEINKFILNNLITFHSIQIVLKNDEVKYGFFDYLENSNELAKENKWCFVNTKKNKKYDFEIIDGNNIKSIKNFQDQLREYYKQKLHEAMDELND